MSATAPSGVPIVEQFRESVAQGRAAIPECLDCGHSFFYPRSRCPFCFGRRLQLIDAAGPWQLRSYCWVIRPQAPEFELRIPILMVVAERLGVNVIAEGDGWRPDDGPLIGAPLRMVIRDPGNGRVPAFERWEGSS